MSGPFGYGGGGYEGAVLDTDPLYTCTHPSGVKISVAWDLISQRLVYRVGWAEETLPVPDDIVNLPAQSAAYELCLREVARVEAAAEAAEENAQSLAGALRQIRKLCAMQSEGAQLIYFRHCIETAVEEEREACALLVSEELARWNCGAEYYANVTEACEKIAAAVRARNEKP